MRVHAVEKNDRKVLGYQLDVANLSTLMWGLIHDKITADTTHLNVLPSEYISISCFLLLYEKHFVLAQISNKLESSGINYT